MNANIKVISGIEPRAIVRKLDDKEKESRRYRTGETFRFPTEIGTIFVFMNDEEPAYYAGISYDTFPVYQYSSNGDFKRIFYFPTNALDKRDYPEAKFDNGERRCINRDNFPYSNLDLAKLMRSNRKAVKVSNVLTERYMPTWNAQETKFEFTGKEMPQTVVRLEIVDIPDFALESAKAE